MILLKRCICLLDNKEELNIAKVILLCGKIYYGKVHMRNKCVWHIVGLCNCPSAPDGMCSVTF